MADRPPIGTFWIGERLRWLDKLSLSSFVAQGHPVTLFHAGLTAPAVPAGVNTARAEAILPDLADYAAALPPSPLSDVFRVQLLRRTPMIWVDTDVICLRPLEAAEGHLIGRQEGTWTNGAVLRAPPEAPVLRRLEEAFADPAAIFPWLDESHRAALATTEPLARRARTAELAGNAFGPMALSHVLEETGEIDRVLPMEVLNPIPWWLGDLYFDPRGTLDHWVTDRTMVLHLYSSRLRPLHKRRRPPKGSPLARIARRIGFDDFS